MKTFSAGLLLALLSCPLLQSAAIAASVELVPSSRVILKLTEAMTVDEIIQRVYPQESALWPQIKQKLMQTNPGSFVPNSDQLIPGSSLKLLDIKRVPEADELMPKVRVGYVSSLRGPATAIDKNDQQLGLQVNSAVFAGDRLETGVGSELHLRLDDGAQVFLKQDSVLILSAYVLSSSDDNGSSILELLRGGFRKITGAIGASPEAEYEVQTGFASLGIRGTEYVLKLCRQDDCTRTLSRDDAQAKLHAAVLEGAISLTTDDDMQIVIASGEHGSATRQQLQLQEEGPVPAGLLDTNETQRFAAAVSGQEDQEQSSKSWIWIVGLLLLVVGL